MASADVLPAASSWEGLKKEADTAFGKGHYAQAVTYYGQAIDLASKSKTDEPARAKLFANRALTYQRAGEHTYPLLSDPSSPRLSLTLLSNSTEYRLYKCANDVWTCLPT